LVAFERALPHAVHDAQERGIPLSMARVSFPVTLGRRASVDAARLVSRLIRDTDFACQDADGSIFVVFTESALRQAHVIARRIAHVLRTTMIRDEAERSPVEATVTLASLKASDTLQSLLERVSGEAMATDQPQVQPESVPT
jgi:GGDEF domain-containing protein